MAAQYFGVGGVAKKVKGQYFGASGAARKVKAGYIGVDNVARKFYTGLDIKPTLADNDWATIAAVSEMGAASTYWSVGDEKDITLSDGETLTLVIVGFDHDEYFNAGTKTAGITFGLKGIMNDDRTMNPTSSSGNTGGFTASEMYSWLKNTLLGQLPTELKNVIKSVYKRTSAGANSSTINTDPMKLFLFSEVEVTGSAAWSYAGEGSQYSYFATNANRIKKRNNGTGAKGWWWLRSPVAGGMPFFACIKETGIADQYYVNEEIGVCFGFCV